MDVQLGGLCVVPHRCSITSSIRRRARRSLRFAALRLIPRIVAASATLCRWMSQRRNTSRQLRRNCKACISTACITPDGILGCSVEKRSRRPFNSSGSVIVRVDVKLDIPVTGYLCFLAHYRRHALLLRPRENVPTDAEAVKNGSGEAEERRLSPRRPSSSIGMLATLRSGLLPGRTREQAPRPISYGGPDQMLIVMVRPKPVSFHGK
jgi:hypothetical protein